MNPKQLVLIEFDRDSGPVGNPGHGVLPIRQLRCVSRGAPTPHQGKAYACAGLSALDPDQPPAGGGDPDPQVGDGNAGQLAGEADDSDDPGVVDGDLIQRPRAAAERPNERRGLSPGDLGKRSGDPYNGSDVFAARPWVKARNRAIDMRDPDPMVDRDPDRTRADAERAQLKPLRICAHEPAVHRPHPIGLTDSDSRSRWRQVGGGEPGSRPR